jgi:hypothetical protein
MSVDIYNYMLVLPLQQNSKPVYYPEEKDLGEYEITIF